MTHSVDKLKNMSYNADMLKIFATLITTFAIFVASPSMAGGQFLALADGQTFCITNYGGKVECNITTPPSTTVKAGLIDLNPVVIGSGLVAASGALYLFSSLRAKTRVKSL